MGPIVSTVIVNHNSGHYLRSCLESLYAQTFRKFEVIVIDNASHDGSLDCLARFPAVQIIRAKSNLGFARAQNIGMRSAKGRYLMPLNFDIVLTDTFLQEMVHAVEQSEHIGSVSGRLLQMSPNGKRTQRIDNAGLLLPRNRFPVHRGADEIDRGQYGRPVLVFGAMGAAALYRREMLEDIAYREQFFDESYFMWYEDIDLEWRARLRGWDCLYTPDAVAYHVGDPFGHGRSSFGARIGIRNRWRMILSNECPHCALRSAPWLIAEELALLKHVIRRGLVKSYLQAVASFLASVPSTLTKRRWVRGTAKPKCLPDYPMSVEGS